jgi:anti-anti-sigma factor
VLGDLPVHQSLPHFHVNIERAGDRTVVAGVGELDLASAEDFAAAVRTHLADGPVLLDLAELAFIDSAGIRILDTLLREVGRDPGVLAIRSELQAPVVQVLRITGMLDALPLEGAPPASGPGPDR